MSNAVKSLYGGAVREKALAGMVGGQEREQEVWTPDWILDASREALGGTIDLDPCAASDRSAWFARINITLPNNSLEMHWNAAGVSGVYVNPPYADLQEWLEKCSQEAARGLAIVGLIPFRPHRDWFWPLLRHAEIVCLRYNVKFVGHKHSFPAPLVLVSWNCEIPNLGPRETHRPQRIVK